MPSTKHALAFFTAVIPFLALLAAPPTAAKPEYARPLLQREGCAPHDAQYVPRAGVESCAGALRANSPGSSSTYMAAVGPRSAPICSFAYAGTAIVAQSNNTEEQRVEGKDVLVALEWILDKCQRGDNVSGFRAVETNHDFIVEVYNNETWSLGPYFAG